MQGGQVSFMAITLLCLLGQEVYGQIPTVCSDATSLQNLECCPYTSDGMCGQYAGKGQCVDLKLPGYDRSSTDVRRNWPHYFIRVCQCNGNYGGYDCSRCKFGYFGDDCSKFQVVRRRPVAKFTDSDWKAYIDVIRQSRSYDSGYMVVLQEAVPGTINLKMRKISLFNLFVWLHHYAAKDSYERDIEKRLDYAHLAPGFVPWHRYYNLLLEWEMQYMLKSMGHTDYHTFRLPYWDWRIEIQRSTGILAEDLFTANKIGATRNVGGFPDVFGDIVGDRWDTICLNSHFNICDPNINTGPLQRCPLTGNDPCNSNNPDWPTTQQVNRAMAFSQYDIVPYNMISRNNFRGFVDAYVHFDIPKCREDRMCLCLPNYDPHCTYTGQKMIAFQQNLHSMVHSIVGLGDFFSNVPPEKQGQMADAAASPNDPFFTLHHVMIDCMFDEWKRFHPYAEYPKNILKTIPTTGHQPDDFMVPFFPLSTNIDMFTLSSEFGYFCDLPNIAAEYPNFG